MELPGDDGLRWIVSTYARITAAYGDAIGTPALVQPTGEFFPDEFRRDAESVHRLLRRIVGYSPLSDDLGLELGFVEEGDAGHGGGCGSLACGSRGGASAAPLGVQELDDGYRVLLSVTDVSSPDALTASLARSVGALVLREGGEEGNADAAEAEIAAIACGFGVVVAGGSAVWAKSCGGLRMAQATVLSVTETAVALALFVAFHGQKPAAARKHLGATQREAFDLAVAWTESNPELIEALRERPAMLEAGLFSMEPVRSLFGRLLGKRKNGHDAPALVAAGSNPPMSEDKRRRLAEARALVDEVLPQE